MKENRKIVWFSCGAASAVAAKLALNKYNNCVIVYCDTSKDEHPDNKRFIKDIESWLGVDIVKLKSEKYTGVDDVIEKTGYLVGIKGARCTTELKKKLRHQYQEADDTHIFGYTLEEATIKGQNNQTRVERFVNNNPELKTEWILPENDLTKRDCLGVLWKQGIEIPQMYKMGYKNNNCIGCVKGGMGYWNKIREDFPEVFAKRAKQERRLNVAINHKIIGNKRIKYFLDELKPNEGNYSIEPDISCGIGCGIIEQSI